LALQMTGLLTMAKTQTAEISKETAVRFV
jgi:hypothetical protein